MRRSSGFEQLSVRNPSAALPSAKIAYRFPGTKSKGHASSLKPVSTIAVAGTSPFQYAETANVVRATRLSRSVDVATATNVASDFSNVVLALSGRHVQAHARPAGSSSVPRHATSSAHMVT